VLHALVLAQQINVGQVPPAPPSEAVEEPTPQVNVRAKPSPRSASDWEVDQDTIASVPHETGADVLGTLPGVYVSNRGLLGQAPHLSLRGFEGTTGQDMEIFVGNIPLNQVSNIHAPGYADMRLVMPEAIRDVHISHGPYDPRQGDFAIAGSTHMDLGLDEPGFLAKGTYGSFNSKRVLLAFAPDDDRWRDSFAAVEAYGTDGPGGAGRGGERASFVGQLAFDDSQVSWRGLIAVGTARFDYPGLLSQNAVEHGEYPYDALRPFGRDLTQQFHIGNEITWEIGSGALKLGVFVSKTKMQFHENLTGYVLDVLAGMPPTNSDDTEQVNEATTYGLNVSYRRNVKVISKRDLVEIGAYSRIDSIDQKSTRLFPDGTIDQRPVDASIGATDIAAYIDAALYPFKRVVVRGGTRLDSLSYSTTDHTDNQGLERTAQGFHLGNKATIDYALGGGVHLLASYGEGFRSPQARELTEGEKVPFATIQSFEAGARMKTNGPAEYVDGKEHVAQTFQTSLVGFASWLSQDRVFDPLTLTNAPAPSSQRLGASAAVSVRAGILGMSASATYAHATFTASDDRFQAGDAVPYAPSFVLRDDTYLLTPLGKLAGDRVRGRFGVGIQGAAGTALPGGAQGKDIVYVDALASVGWRALDLSLNGMNLLGLRYYDAQYVYTSNFAQSAMLPPPSARVLVAPPTSIFLTLQVRLGGNMHLGDE
jgi:iron complex outermembrane receptor protein